PSARSRPRSAARPCPDPSRSPRPALRRQPSRPPRRRAASPPRHRVRRSPGRGPHRGLRTPVGVPRSEEHTSELQSRFDLVCRLLLEKKKYNVILTVEDIPYTITTNT